MEGTTLGRTKRVRQSGTKCKGDRYGRNCLVTRPTRRDIVLALSGVRVSHGSVSGKTRNLPSKQREIVATLLGYSLERVGRMIFETTIPQVQNLLEKEGVSAGKDTVGETLRNLQELGWADLKVPYQEWPNLPGEGARRMPGLWRIDFSMFAGDIFNIPVAEIPPIPTGRGNSKGTSNSREYRQHQTKAGGGVQVPDEWTGVWESILEILGRIPSPRPLAPAIVANLVRTTSLSSEEALEILEAAGRDGVSRPEVKDARAWALTALKNPSFARRYRIVAEPPVEPAPAPATAPEPPADDLEALQEELVAAGMGRGGAAVGIRFLRETGMDPGHARIFVEEARTATREATRRGYVDPGNQWAFMVHLMKARDEKVTWRASKAWARQERLMAELERSSPDKTDGWSALLPEFRVVPGVREAWVEWRHLHGSAPSPDSPGFLDHLDQEKSAYRKLLAHGETFLGSRAASIKAGVIARLEQAGFKSGSPAWDRASRHNVEYEIKQILGIGA